MHAQDIIQDLLDAECPQIHAKRRRCLAAMAEAARGGELTLMGMSRALPPTTCIRQRIKRCDRLMGNQKLEAEAPRIYAAMARRVVAPSAQPAVIVDWSDLRADQSRRLLRAALMVRGRAVVLYEEAHPVQDYGVAKVHRAFLRRLKSILPPLSRPVIITDAGFRAAWFKMVERLGWAWIGRIRNRDMVRPRDGAQPWQRCKSLYAQATNVPRDLGHFDYVRSNPVACRLVVVKKRPKGRHRTTLAGQRARNTQSLKTVAGQTEPWLLAASPRLAPLNAVQIVELYRGRMQIEQSFRDLKNPRWGLGLSHSQTRNPKRLAVLLLIGTLAMYALWLIGLAARSSGYDIEYGSRKKAPYTLSVISLAQWWLREACATRAMMRPRIRMALEELCAMVVQI